MEKELENEEKKVEPYKFTLLKDGAVDEDSFDDLTHEKIAEVLYKIIHDENGEGITIGLEGDWGSGKSTIISILKKKLMEEKCNYFYFDAWEHEGDPLRKIFIKSIINQINEDKKCEALSEIDEEISNPIFEKKIESKQSMTTLGKLISIAAFIVPLGVILCTNVDFKILRIFIKSSIDVLALFGILFTVTPLLILLGNILYHLYKKKKNKNKYRIFTKDHWRFLSGEHNVTVNEETYKSDRSSIEFEEYFERILHELLRNDNDKIVIVVDNLDRIDSADSLKIWSTLQTFLQRRNPINPDKQLYKNVWIIVPFDNEGLRRIWNLNDSNNNDTYHKSFFDKCFQIRLEVPPLLISNWDSFCKKKIDEALLNLSEEKKQKILNVLTWTRESVHDSPSPREIITYINQIGILLGLYDKYKISVEAISYYVIKRYLKSESIKSILNELINGTLIKGHISPVFDSDEIESHISGIIHGVKPDKGKEILIEKQIENALSNNDTKDLINLVNKHNSAFWSVFNFHVMKMNDNKKIFQYCKSVHDSLWTIDKEKCAAFLGIVNASALKWTKINFPIEDFLKTFISFLSLLNIRIDTLNYVLKLLSDSFIVAIKEKKSSIDSLVISLKQITESLGKEVSVDIDGSDLSLDIWKQLSVSMKSNNTDLNFSIKPSNDIVDLISAEIITGSPIQVEIADVVSYAVKSGVNDWNILVGKLSQHITANHNNANSFESISLIIMIYGKNEETDEAIRKILNTGQFWHMMSQPKMQKWLNGISLLLAHITKGNISKFTVPVVGNSQTSLQTAINWWNIDNEKNAQFVWKRIKSHSDFSFIWILLGTDNKRLLSGILKLAIKENIVAFFDVNNAYRNYCNAYKYLDDDIHKELAVAFITNSKIEEGLNNDDFQFIDNLSTELLNIIKNSKKTTLRMKASKALSVLDKDRWNKAFNTDSFEIIILLYLHSKNNEINLNNSYCDAFIEILKEWCSGNKKPTDLQKAEMDQFVAIMQDEFKQHVKDEISRYFIHSKFKIMNIMHGFILRNFNHDLTFLERKDGLQEALEHGLNSKDKETLTFISVLLNSDMQRKFKPLPKMKKVFKDPFYELIETADNEEEKKLFINLAKRNGIDWSPNLEKENRDINEQ